MRPVSYLAPFAADGSLLHYANPYRPCPPVPGTSVGGGTHWRVVEPFDATLTIAAMHSGRSAKYTEWTDTDGRRYPMFVADLIALLSDAVIVRGTVSGTWIVRKRGENYGVRFLAPAPAVPKGD